MRAIILAAGRGARMGGLTATQPKCLLRLHGTRLIDWQLGALRAAGLREIAIVRGYRGDVLSRRHLGGAFTRPYRGDVPPRGHRRDGLALTFFDNPRWATTSSVASLAAAAAWLRSDTCIVSYSDIVYDARTVAALRAAAGDLAITYDPHWLALWRARFADPLSDAETFRVDAGGALREIGGRARDAAEIQGQYMGLVKCTPRGWSRMAGHLAACSEESRDRLDVTALLRGLLAEGATIMTVPSVGRWYEVDSAGDLAAYQTMEPIASDPLFADPSAG